MIVTYSDDSRVVYKINLSDTNYHSLVDCQSKEVKTLESMMVSCGGTPTTFTFSFNDGTNDYLIYNALAMAANTTIAVTDFHPKVRYLDGTSTSQKLRVKASNANQISVVAVMIDHLPVKDNNAALRGKPGA